MKAIQSACKPNHLIVAEISVSDGPIETPEFAYDEISKSRALNRIMNLAEVEQWEEWEIREAVRQVMEEGKFTEKRPAFYLKRYRKGVVVAAGAGTDAKIGEAVLFAYGLSANWRSFWRDTVGIAAESKVVFTDGASVAVAVDSNSPIHIVPEKAVLVSIPYNLAALETIEADERQLA